MSCCLVVSQVRPNGADHQRGKANRLAVEAPRNRSRDEVSQAEVLDKHLGLEVESIDRMCLNVYVPQLQAVVGTLKFIPIHRVQHR